MNDKEQSRARSEIVQAIHDSGGEKTFVIGQTPVDVVRCLMDLIVDRVIEIVPNPDPMARTYRLKAGAATAATKGA